MVAVGGGVVEPEPFEVGCGVCVGSLRSIYIDEPIELIGKESR
jgi:hypothetical protein